jgi:putative ABC transport system permease protein
VRNIRKRKLRSWLTLLGIFVSVAVIFILISLSLGLQGAIQEQFRLLGTDKFFIMPKGQLAATGGAGAVQMTLDDLEIVEKVSGVKIATYANSGNAKIEFSNEKPRYFMIAGIPPGIFDFYMETVSISVVEGRPLEKGDSGKILIGWDYKFNNVYSKPVNIGDKMIINGIEFKVIGIMSRIGNPQDDKNIMMDIEDFRILFNSGDRVDSMIVQIESGNNIKEVADRVEKKLMKFRNVDEENVDFTIMTPEELLRSFNVILVVITSFLISVGSISLIVGGIGIANTMYTSVLERIREIGIMKAVGARNKDIILIFVIESGLIGMIGGIMGVGFGILISKTIEFIAVNQLGTTLLKAATPVYLIAGCVLFAFIIGAFSGVMPARQASKIKVVDALRYE